VSVDNEAVTCPVCGNKFDTQEALNWHRETDHDEPKSPPRRYR
jgi:hypothetical protein